MKTKYNPRMSFLANKKIELPTKMGSVRKKKECRHYWRVGSFIGGLRNGKIRKIGINIWCEKCSKRIIAHTNSSSPCLPSIKKYK